MKRKMIDLSPYFGGGVSPDTGQISAMLLVNNERQSTIV
jgi:hypothetical protein